ncbi:retrovirus-related pol polyprotein from transposon TNT 1-94 [Tanacetum coccineum]
MQSSKESRIQRKRVCSDSKVDSCSKSCVKAYVTLNEQYDDLSSDYKKSQFNLVSYKAGLQSVEERLAHYKKNETVLEEKINVLNLEVKLREQRRLGYNVATSIVESFVNSSKMLESQENEKSRSNKGYHAVPPPKIGNFMPPKLDLMFIDKQVESEFMDVVSNVASSKVNTVESKLETADKGVVDTNTVKKNSFGPLIIEDWNSDNDSEVEFTPNKTIGPSFEKIKFVNFEHLHYVCDKKVVRPVWNNSSRVNHKNFANKLTHPHPKRGFVPQEVLTRSGKINTAGASVNTVVRQVNTTDSKTTVNHPKLKSNVFKRGYSQDTRSFNRNSANKNSIFNKKVNIVSVNDSTARPRAVVSKNMGKGVNAVKASACWGNPQQKEYKEKGVIDSGCSRHMTGNKCYLTEYEDYDGGFVSFGDGKGRISGKGKIKTGTLDFNDVYFCEELKYNLFSMSQMCDKKNNVCFIDTECLVLSSDFKLLDESQVLLRVPRKDNIYSVDLKSIVPTGGLTCLFAKATIDESNLWHRRLGHINFKNINKLVKGNLNGVAERKNRTLIEDARTMLVDFKLPTTFWAKAVNTACYVLNRALVIKPHNTTPYELIRGRPPLIDFMKPFGCLVTILNTRDHLGKFEGKADEGFFVGYFVTSKAMRVFNKRTRIVEETLNIRFLENAPNVKGNGPDWLFDIDSLTISMNYVPVVAGNQTNGIAGTKDNIIAGQAEKKKAPEQEYIIIPLYTTDPLISQGPKDSNEDGGMKPTEVDEGGASDNNGKDAQDTRSESERIIQKERQTNHTNILILFGKPDGNWNKWVFKNKKDERGKCSPEISKTGCTMMDLKSAFLYGTIKKEVYVCQPPVSKIHISLTKSNKVEKALYGLTSRHPSSLGSMLMIVIFGSTKNSLGYEVLKKFDFATVKTTSTPIETNKALVKDEEAEAVDVHLYRSMIGSLMYLTASRPDIMFVVCACARFQVTPKTSHIHVVKRIFRYLKGQPKLGLWYPRDSPFDLEAFSDSDYAGASLDRKSTTGGCQFLGKRLISWQCKKQTIVANSTTEAEYVTSYECYGSGSGLRCHVTILGGATAQTKIEDASKQSNDPPLLRGYTLGSEEDSYETNWN